MKEKTNLTRLVLSITRMTTHNGPGIRTLVLFKGCPLTCVWCSTPESQNNDPEIAISPNKCIHCNQCIQVCPMGALTYIDDEIHIIRNLCIDCGKCSEVCYTGAIMVLGKHMTFQELLTEVKKDEVIFKHSRGGVTLSGGEPLLYPAFNLKLLGIFKKENINIGIDTCGHVPLNCIEEVLPFIDFFLWDIKHMDPVKHSKLTGVSNKLILQNLRYVSNRKVPVYVRLPIIPRHNDSEENIRRTCDFVSRLESVVEVNIIPMHHLGKARYYGLGRPYPIAGTPLISDETLRKLVLMIESYGLICSITQ